MRLYAPDTLSAAANHVHAYLVGARALPFPVSEAATHAASVFTWTALVAHKGSRKAGDLMSQLKRAHERGDKRQERALIAQARPVHPGAVGEKPREVRFFHDSMQSYLTALGLFQSGDWGALFEAAGAERFVGSGRESELFRMCTQVFVPNGRLRTALHDSLEAVTRSSFGGVSRDAVARVMAPDLREIAEQRALHTGTDELIRAALEVCRERDGDGRPRCVINLFVALAPLLWSVQQRAPRVPPAGTGAARAEVSAPAAS